MINLKIDPEFQSQIPPLTDDEFKQIAFLFGAQVSPSQLIPANPRNGFFAVLKSERHGGEINLSGQPVHFSKEKWWCSR